MAAGAPGAEGSTGVSAEVILGCCRTSMVGGGGKAMGDLEHALYGWLVLSVLFGLVFGMVVLALEGWRTGLKAGFWAFFIVAAVATVFVLGGGGASAGGAVVVTHPLDPVLAARTGQRTRTEHQGRDQGRPVREGVGHSAIRVV